MSHHDHTRRDFLAGSGGSRRYRSVRRKTSGCGEGKKQTFTILHTNDIHSNLIGMGPASDYTPFKLNDDKTIGGIARSGHLDHPEKRGTQRSGARADSGRR